ncbi:MAG: TrmB family transcriptional regulator [Clostridia bacterium]|jgi:sugar-specific transcriptional regulator TrmB|nr:TrmB family transcriptional regulator [Clostridia bacterium]
MDFNEALQKIGFSPLEATVYITLCKHGNLTGYEVAKLSGISRSNIYAALYSLQDKGMCHVSEGESTKYVPLSKEELILSAKRNMTKTLADIEEHFPDRIDVSEPYVTIKGYDNVLSKIKNSILQCKSHLYILSTSSYIELLKEELFMISQTKKVTILCDKKIDISQDVTFGIRNKSPQGFHMIIDTKSVITGDLKHEGSQCLYSSNQSLVRLMRESFITELDMITLTNH